MGHQKPPNPNEDAEASLFKKFNKHRDVAQLVARLVWEQDTEPTPDKNQKRRKAL